MKLRKLNDEGVRLFAEYIAGGAEGPPPVHLLQNPETSDALPGPSIICGTADFSDRYQFGIYLRTLFSSIDASAINTDRNFWTSLALIWFDRICPQLADGSRKLAKDYHYILSSDYRHYYRHLVRSPWYMVSRHGESAKLLLIATRQTTHPLSVHGEVMEQIGGRQQILSSTEILKAAYDLYFDKKAGRPKKGLAGRGAGSANRFGMVLRQLELTYDPAAMPDNSLITILPKEFDRWKPPATTQSEQAAPSMATA
jgi:hypothetical protein